MAEDEVGIKLNLDSADFTSGMKEALKSIYDLGSADLSELLGKFKTIGAEVAVMAGAVYAAKKAFDWEQEAEAIIKIQKQFQVLSENAGVSGEAILSGMKIASGGLIGTTDLMKLANEQFIKLGSVSSQLPQIMEVARKASIAMGTDFEETFKNISNGIAFGNERMLKHAGIVINAKKAYETYAESIGATVDELTQSGKQQAILNAVLEVGSTKLKGINEDTQTVTNSFKMMWVAIKEIGETFLLIFDKLLGPLLKEAAKNIGNFFADINDNIKYFFGSAKESAEANLSLTNRQITELQDRIKDAEKFKATIGFETVPGQIEKMKAELAALKKQKDELAGPEQTKSEERPLEQRKEEDIDHEKHLQKKKEADEKYAADVATLNDQRIKEEEKAADSMVAVDKNQNEQREQFAREYANAIQSINNDSTLSHKQKQEKISQTEALYYAKAKNNEQELSDKRAKAAEKYAVDNQTAFQKIGAQMEAQSKRAHANLTDMNKTGAVVFGAIGNNAKNAFLAVGEGSKSAGEAMRGFMLGALADIAENQGEAMLLEGIWPPNPAAIAAGGALLVLAGAMRSQAGTSGALGGGHSGGGGGGGYYSDTSATSSTAPTAQPQEKKTVTVQIMGHVFDSDQTGTRIAEMIRNTADATDYVYKPVGTA